MTYNRFGVEKEKNKHYVTLFLVKFKCKQNKSMNYHQKYRDIGKYPQAVFVC